MIELTVIAVFSVVQSLFGIGLLVFGTPTLLLLGFPFDHTLAVLLPASLAISVLQVLISPRVEVAFARSFVIWCLVPIGVTLALVFWLQLQSGLNLVVALALAAFVAQRWLPQRGEVARRWVAQHERTCLLLMGVVHGLSNLGGGLLTIFAASRRREKVQIRGLISFCYAGMATSQLIVLAWLHSELFGWRQLVYAAISSCVFLIVGQRVFRGVSNPLFEWLLTAFMTGFAGLLGLRTVGLL